MTVKEFIETKYKPAFFAGLKSTTRDNYEQYLKLNILPFLGNYHLEEVKVDTAMFSFHYVPRAESDSDVHRYMVITESAISVVHSKKAESATMINVGRTYALL